MKKAFTLAEVLITLAIIGVIAAFTLPALMTNIAEQQFISGFKKSVNTLTEIGSNNKAKYGFGYGGITSSDKEKIYDDEGNVEQSLYAILMANGMNAKYFKSEDIPNLESGSMLDGGVLLNDGTMVIFSSWTSTGWVVVAIDINGKKGPNIFSNCDGNTTYNDGVNINDAVKLLRYNAGYTLAGMDKCKDKANRVIKDRFVVGLTDEGVIPLDGATRWALEQ